MMRSLPCLRQIALYIGEIGPMIVHDAAYLEGLVVIFGEIKPTYFTTIILDNMVIYYKP
jgi:hypothetical protein